MNRRPYDIWADPCKTFAYSRDRSSASGITRPLIGDGTDRSQLTRSSSPVARVFADGRKPEGRPRDAHVHRMRQLRAHAAISGFPRQSARCVRVEAQAVREVAEGRLPQPDRWPFALGPAMLAMAANVDQCVAGRHPDGVRPGARAERAGDTGVGSATPRV